MIATLPTVSELNALVTPEILATQGFRKPQRVVVREVVLEDGSCAYEVWVVYPKSVPETELGLKKTQPMRDWIFNTIRSAVHEERWPYVRLATGAHAPPSVTA